ncbi:helix-turn-helix domain-containing protein [Actinomycetes bacterium KLBMP 9797]
MSTHPPDPTDHPTSLAAVLRQARQAAQLTQEELAERSGMSVRAISNLERQRVRHPQRRSLRALSQALGLADHVLDLALRTARRAATGPPLDPAAARDRLSAALAAARDGTGAAMLLRGRPTTVRTGVLDAVSRRAGRDGWTVLRANAVPAEHTLPYAALHMLLTPVLSELDGLDAALGAALRGALGLGGPEPAHRTSAAVATLELLRRVATQAPLLALVDDVQWLDDASAVVLGFVARRLAGTNIALVLAGSAAGSPALIG